jgi:hypothetical protein
MEMNASPRLFGAHTITSKIYISFRQSFIGKSPTLEEIYNKLSVMNDEKALLSLAPATEKLELG